MLSVISLLLAFSLVGFASPYSVSFHPSNPTVVVDHKLDVLVRFHGNSTELQEVKDGVWMVTARPSNVLAASSDDLFSSSIECDLEEGYCNGTVELTGLFLGLGKVEFQDQSSLTGFTLNVTVLREDKILNHIFTAFVAVVVSINYINMGCALDLEVVKKVLKRPIGPAVGFVCQFVIMPLVAYGVGYLIFEDPVLRLGLFTYGSSPGGGASNMWTVLLDGNLNLSITMTFVSTLAALGTLPLWLFTLGKTIIQGTDIVIPFTNILYSLGSFAVPIGIGLLVQRRFPSLAARSKRVLAPVCIALIVGIIVIGSVANSYIFYMLTWRTVLAASLSVWTGFAAGGLVGTAFRFSREDIVAVAVETGIQNSGIAFLLLSYSLKAPVSDMASVVPVSGTLITPLPLLLIYCVLRVRKRCKGEEYEVKQVEGKVQEKEMEEQSV